MTELNFHGRKTLPARGQPWNELQVAMSDMRGDDPDWRYGPPLNVYYAGEDVLDVARRAYAMFICEDALAPAAFPSLRRMQDDIVAISLSLLGGGDDAVGTMTSGGSESIVLAVRSAHRAFRARHPGVRRPHLLMPSSAHPAYDKAADLMGVDVVRVSIGGDYRASVDVLAQCISSETMMIVASAPSLPFGAIDPVEDIARLAREYEVWLHVDACVGGFLAPHVACFLPGLPRFDLSIPGVRSLSADLHKFGYAAKGASVLLYADAEDQEYQHFEYFDWPKGVYRTDTLSGTRPGGAVAAAWAVLHYLGESGYRALAQRVMHIRDRYIEGIERIPGLHLLGAPHLSVIAFGSDEYDIHLIGDAMQARGWPVSRLSNPAALHLTLTPGHDQSMDAYLSDLERAVHQRERGALRSQSRTVVAY